MPAYVCGIDPNQPVHQAQRKAADAALGEVGLEHRREEGHIATAGGLAVELYRGTWFPDGSGCQ